MSYAYLFTIGYFFFILNFEEVFAVDQAVVISKAFLLASAFAAVLTRRLRFGVFLLSCTAILILVASALMTSFPGFNWLVWIRASNQVIVPLLLLSVTPARGDRDIMLRTSAFSPLFCVAVGCVYQVTGLGSVFGVDYENHVPRLQGSLEPAFLASITLVAALSALALTQHVNKNYMKLFFVNCFILLLTAARMPLALTTLICGYYFVFELKVQPVKKWLVALMSGLGAAIFLVTAGQAIIQRFTTAGSSGRDVLWQYYHLIIERYWDFGVGFGHSTLLVPHQISAKIGGVVAAHNEYLRFAAELGVMPAVAMLVVFLWIVVLIWFSSGPTNFLFPIAALGFLIFCYTDNAVSSPTNYPLLIIAAYALDRRSSRRRTRRRAVAIVHRPDEPAASPAIQG